MSRCSCSRQYVTQYPIGQLPISFIGRVSSVTTSSAVRKQGTEEEIYANDGQPEVERRRHLLEPSLVRHRARRSRSGCNTKKTKGNSTTIPFSKTYCVPPRSQILTKTTKSPSS